MAKRRMKVRRTNLTENGTRDQRWFSGDELNVSVIPRVFAGAASGAEVLAIGVIQLTRNTLMALVGGAAELGTRAVHGTAAAAHGIMGTTFEIVGEAADVATNTVKTAVTTVRDVGAEMGQAIRHGARRPASSESRSTTKASATRVADGPKVMAQPKGTRARKTETVAAA
jgi:hypothetical protein